MTRFAEGLDAIIHCAGMNRGEEAEVEATNIWLARQVAHACEAGADRGARYPSVIFVNSTHAGRNTGYGRGKRVAAETLADSAARHGANFTNLILPHVFGEFGKPFYNSVVSTFCHQLASGKSPSIQIDAELELVHAQRVAARCMAAIDASDQGDVRVSGVPLKVSELLEKLGAMAESYVIQHVIPELCTDIDSEMFNTLRSYCFPGQAATMLTLHEDPRGTLFEAVKTRHGGQAFLSTTRPGITRGNHFHTTKFERFLVCSGEAEIRLRRLFSEEVHTFRVNGDRPCYIDMPTFYTHSITNIGRSDVVTMFWAGEIFDPARPDTFSEMVLP